MAEEIKVPSVLIDNLLDTLIDQLDDSTSVKANFNKYPANRLMAGQMLSKLIEIMTFAQSYEHDEDFSALLPNLVSPAEKNISTVLKEYLKHAQSNLLKNTGLAEDILSQRLRQIEARI